MVLKNGCRHLEGMRLEAIKKFRSKCLCFLCYVLFCDDFVVCVLHVVESGRLDLFLC